MLIDKYHVYSINIIRCNVINVAMYSFNVAIVARYSENLTFGVLATMSLRGRGEAAYAETTQ